MKMGEWRLISHSLHIGSSSNKGFDTSVPVHYIIGLLCSAVSSKVSMSRLRVLVRWKAFELRIVHLKIQIWLFPRVASNLVFFTSVEQVRRCLAECLSCSFSYYEQP